MIEIPHLVLVKVATCGLTRAWLGLKTLDLECGGKRQSFVISLGKREQGAYKESLMEQRNKETLGETWSPICEMAQVILVWMMLPGIKNASHPQR